MDAPVLEKATRFLVHRLESQAWPSGCRLPTLTRLAQMADVSRKTMVKAVADLKKAKKISAKRGGRITAGDLTTEKGRLPEAGNANSWEAKRALLEQDILNGAFPVNGPFASRGELQSRYGVSYYVLSKMLNSLAADRIIIAAGKKFYLRNPKQVQRRGHVCLIWEGLIFGEKPRPAREGRIAESIQKESSIAECIPHFLSIDFNAVHPIDKIRAQIRKQELILGYIIRMLDPIGQAGKSSYLDLLLELSRDKKPIAILDESNEATLPEPLASNRLIKIFGIGGYAAGKAVARILLEQGHRRIAFLSYHRSEPWSAKRFQGLAAEFSKAGFPDAVRQFTMDEPGTLIRMLLAPSAGTRSRKITDSSPAHVSADELDSHPLLGRHPWLRTCIEDNRNLIGRLRAKVAAMASIPKKAVNELSLEVMTDHAVVYMERELLKVFCAKLFADAAEDRSITAWVGANDDIAIFGQEYLRGHGIAVPTSISVIGFDGDPRGFEHQLTSYDFDFGNIARQMLSFIFQPASRAYFSKKQYIEMQGLVIWRESVTDKKAS